MNQRGRTRTLKKAAVLAVIAVICLCAVAGIMMGTRAYQEEKIQETKRQELLEASGSFNEESIVLADTTPEMAQKLAELLQARLRMTPDGSYAVLYLPEGVHVEDVFADEEYKAYLSEMSLDYYVNTEAVDANNRELIAARPSFVVTDEQYPQQNYLDFLNLQDTWETTRGAGVTVAVIDSGIDMDHPEFAGKISNRSYDASNDRIVSDYGLEVIEDEDGHGTAVAGIIAAGMNDGVGITGIAPEAELLVIKCETNGSGQFLRGSDLVFALAYAIECDADVVNMSFGISENIFSKYTQLAVDSDIICVAAAGNDGSAMPSYPAADENVIGVGAMDMDTWNLADYSNYGFSLVLAPGTAYTTALNGGYQSTTGTSVSSPMVSSAVALYLSCNPYTEFDEMCELLKASSVDLGILGEDRQHGFGALDIHALVCEEKGTITYEMLTDELKRQTQIFVKGHTIQYMPEPERENVVLEGWYYDIECTDEVTYYDTVFSDDTTLYAAWINEDEGTVYIYTTLEDGTVEIRSYTGRRRYLTVPSVLGGKTVTGIGEYAFAGNTRLRSVDLPDTLKYISTGAFSDCTNIRDIEIPETVETIGNEAFYGCVSLSQAVLLRNSAMTTIGDRAFGMSGIRTIYLPEKLSTLGSGVFYGSTGMTSVTVEAGNTSYQIRSNALYDAAGTTLIYYPAGLTGSYTLESNTLNVAEYAFAYSKAAEINLNEGLRAIGSYAFENSNIRTMNIPASVTEMGEYCCAYSALTELCFAEGITLDQIPAAAFYSCNSLRTVELPAGITQIGDRAFGKSGLMRIDFEEGSKLETIGSSAFSTCPIQKINFPATLRLIDTAAFDSCWRLAEVTWEQGSQLTSIGPYAFEDCTALKHITLPDNLKEVHIQAFFASGLEELTIGTNLTRLGEGAFSGCRSLQAIQVDEGNPAYTSVDGVLFSADETVLHTYPAGRSGTYILPETVVRIESYAFAIADKLPSVVMNTGLETLGNRAFSRCSALSTPELPASLTKIEDNAFEYCASMSGSLLIPKNVISIGQYAFYQNFALTQIIIEPESSLSRIGYGTFGYCGITDFTVPGTVSTMGQEVFVGCKNLLTVTFEADSQLTAIAAWTFSGADELRQITFEEGSRLELLEARSLEGLWKLERVALEHCTRLATIDNYAFQHCISLTEITLPESLKTIGRYAFNGCQSLSRIDLPESVSFIGRYAFNRTNDLNVYFQASVLPLHLQENWDYGIAGYYVSTARVITSGDWQYALTNDGKASIIGYTGSETHIDLTDLDGYEIISIGGYAFADNTTLESIVLPDTLQGVYRYAFKGTAALKSITIPAAVAIIDNGAFQSSGLSSVIFAGDSALVSLGRYAFADTVNLTEIAIPDGVEAIHDYCFRGSGIQNITFGENSALTEIGRYAFMNSKLESIVIPSGVTRIDYDAFRSCAALTQVDLSKASELQIFANAFYGTGLTEVSIPAGVEYIGEFCFAACPNLMNITVAADNENYASVDGVLYNKALTKLITCPAGLTGSYTVPGTVTTLGFAAFEESRLSEVIFPEDSVLVALGYRVFYNCDNLTAITIPAGVQSIDNYAFAECGNLASVTISADSQLGGIYKSAFYNCTALTGITIPAGVQEIGDYAFYGCTSLTELNIPGNSQLKCIYDYAFTYTGVTEFTMPAGLEEIGERAFQGAKLDTLVWNEAIITIGDYAFADCGLANSTVLEIPDTVRALGYGMIQGAANIEEMVLPTAEESWTVHGLFGTEVDGVAVDLPVKKITVLGGSFVNDRKFAGLGNLETVILAEGIHTLGQSAFEGAVRLTSVNLPDSLVSIGMLAFQETYSLTKLDLPDSLQTIGIEAFDSSGLSDITLPEGLIEIGQGAFRFTQISRITIPASVKVIGSRAFAGCDNLEYIEIAEGNPNFRTVDGILYSADLSAVVLVPKKLSGEITIPEGVLQIPDSAFSGRYISKVNLPESLDYIGMSAFSSCVDLTEVTIPANVRQINQSAFSGCRGLKSFTLTSGNTDISAYMLSGCTGLTECNLPEGVTAIPTAFFSGCTSLEHVVLPESLVSIGNRAFSGCVSLKTIYLTKNVQSIGLSAFKDCTAHQTIEVDPENAYLTSFEGIVYTKDYSTMIANPGSISGTVTLPDGLITIAAGAFSYCKNLEAVVIPNSVTEILDEAFYECDGLQSVIIPDSVQYIGDKCFRECSNLSEIQIGSNVRHIGAYSFYGTAFSYDTANWSNDVLYLSNYALMAKDVERIDIREGTTLLTSWMVRNYTTAEAVYIPDSVKYISRRTFDDCQQLHSLRLPENVQEVNELAVCNHRNLMYFRGGAVEDSYIGHACYFLGPAKVVYIPYSSRGYISAKAIEKLVISTTGNMDVDYLRYIPQSTVVYCYVDESAGWPAGWNGGRTTYYKDEWHLATFYADGIIVTMDAILASGVVQEPSSVAVAEYLRPGAEFLGWDINGDGLVDEIPVILTEDLEAHAVLRFPVTEITLSETETTMEVTDEKTLTVSYYPSYYNTGDALIWSSSDETVATVDEAGKITALAEGEVTITATLAENSDVSASCTVTVIPLQPGIRLKETEGALNVGESLTLEPRYVLLEDVMDTLTFTSSDETVASVDQNGTITAIAPGTAQITISCGEYSAVYTVNVLLPAEKITITAESDAINVGETQTLTVQFTPENTTDDRTVTWRSSDSTIARVDNSGFVTAIAPGTVTITATTRNGMTAEYTMTVYAPIQWIVLNTTTGTIRLDRTKQMEVIYEPSNTTDDKTVTWSTSNPEVATISDTGLVTGVKAGTAVITGTVGEHSATYTVTVVGLKDAPTGIIVTNSDDTPMEEDVSLVVDPVDNEELDSTYEGITDRIGEEMMSQADTDVVVSAYDITLQQNGESVQPDTMVDVEIPAAQDLDTDSVQVFRVEEDGSLTDMTAQYQDQNVSFNTEHFSLYILCGKKKPCESHAFKDWQVSVEASCTESGEEFRKCDRCGFRETRNLEPKGHDLSAWESVKAATCTEDGTESRKCSRCDHSETRTIAAIGHSYESVVTAPTCGMWGYTTHTCLNCGDSYVDNYVDGLDHDMSDWQILQAATCTEDGSESRKCSRCDHSETRTIAATGHSYEAVVTAATCTDKGYTTHTCSNCGDSYVDSHVDALGHNMGTWTTVKAATCTEDGTESRKCSRCDHSETRTIAAIGHSYGSWQTTREPTCTEAGEKQRSCSACGRTETETLSAKGHSYEAVVTAPTCTEEGFTVYTCSACGDSYTSDYVTPKGHSYEAAVTAPTCTEKGYTTHTCTACGDSYVDTYVDALGHTMGPWHVVNPASCEEVGEERTDCEVCDYYESRTIAALGHSWDAGTVTVEPTEETEGEMLYTCTSCGATRTEVIPVLEHTHSYESTVIAPTCTEQGYTLFTCRCGHSYTDAFVEALGHDMSAWTVVKEADCTEKGEERSACSRCDHAQTREIPALGHAYESTVTEPTCSAQGYVTHTCTRCGDSYADSYTDALGHSFTRYVSDGNAGCTTDGTMTAKCDRCDATDTKTESGSALGHSHETQVTEPTCEAGGYTTYTCTRCGDSYVADYTEALGHSYENGECIRCHQEEYQVTWKSATTSLNGTIDLNIYVVLSENLLDAENAYVRFSYANKVVDVPVGQGVESVSNGVLRYRYSCPMYAKEVSETVTVQVMKDGEVIGEKLEYSIVTYCMNRIQKSKNPAQVALCKALLNYASAAQVSLKYNVENLANAGLAEADKVLPETIDVSAYALSISGSETGIRAKSATLMLESEVSVRVYFTLESGCDISDYTFTIDGKVVQPEKNNTGWFIETEGIAAKDLDRMVEFSVGGITVKYGPMSYVYSKLSNSKTSDDTINLVKALYAYWQAAEALLG